MLIKQMFSGEVAITDKHSFNKADRNVSVILNQKYESGLSDNNFDLYYPKGNKASLAVLIWVHSGGYIGGDKNGVKEFATKIVSDTEIDVVSMNYELAANSQYPNYFLVAIVLGRRLACNMLILKQILNMAKQLA